MPFALILLGLALVISAIRGTHRDLGTLLRDDFSGKDNFLIWGIAFGALGVIGYNQKAETFSRSFMTLVLLAMILSNGGVFKKFVEALSGVEGGASVGSGSAGNTLANPPATGKPAGMPRGGSPTGEIGEAVSKGVALGNTIVGAVTQPVSLVKSVLRSVPIIGKLF